MKDYYALKTKNPSSTDAFYQIGDEILIYRVKESEGTARYEDIYSDNGMVYVIVLYNKTQPLQKQLIKTFINIIIDHSQCFIHLSNKFRSGCAPIAISNVYMTEFIYPADPRYKDGNFDEAKKKELKGLCDRGTFQVVLKKEVPNDANVLGGRVVLSIKDEGTEREVRKARFKVKGYRDKVKISLVHESANSIHHSVRLLIRLASIFGFRLSNTDVMQSPDTASSFAVSTQVTDKNTLQTQIRISRLLIVL